MSKWIEVTGADRNENYLINTQEITYIKEQPFGSRLYFVGKQFYIDVYNDYEELRKILLNKD